MRHVRPAVVRWAVQVGCVLWLDVPLASGGRTPRLWPSSEGLGLSPGAWGAPFKGNADGVRSIFGNAGRVWATALRLAHQKKGLCHTRPVGGTEDKYHQNIRKPYRFSAFWLGRLAFVPDGRSKPRADSGPNRPPASAGQPSGGRAAFLIPMHALYSTRPHSPVQAIFWHTCPDLDLGPWYGLTH